MRKPLLVAICQFMSLNHHERGKLTPDYDDMMRGLQKPMAYILTQRKGTHTKKYQKKRGTKGLGEGLNKLKRKTKEQSRMDNPETRNIDINNTSQKQSQP